MPIPSSPKAVPTPWDALVVLAVAALAALCVWGLRVRYQPADPAQLVAVVSADGGETDRIPLSGTGDGELRTYTSNGYTLELTLNGDSARITAADCPNQDCVHTRAITRSGQSIVCLPARLTVTLEGGGAPDVDAVLG